MRIVVIGAGIVGSSIAFHLARRDAEVILIDRSKPGTGASSHSFAWINAGHKPPFAYHDFNRRSMDIWDRFSQQLEVDVGLRWGGKISWQSAPGPAEELRNATKHLQSWGYPIRLIDAGTLTEMEPGLSPGPIEAAEYSEIEGHVEPSKVIDACITQVLKQGGQVLSNTELVALESSRGDKVQSVTTTTGDIACDAVVLAGGIDNTMLASHVGAYIPQQSSPGVVIRTDPQPKLLKSVSVVYLPPLSEQDKEVHLRQLSDGTLMIGEGSQESLAADDSQLHADNLLARAVQYFPALEEANAIPVPVGYRPMPLDGYPVLGFVKEAPNVYMALTHSGVTLAPIIGQLASIEIMDGTNVESLGQYRPGRFHSK